MGRAVSRQRRPGCHRSPDAAAGQAGCSSPLPGFASRASPSCSISSRLPSPPPLCSTSVVPVPVPRPSFHSCLPSSGATTLVLFPRFSLDLSFPLEFADSTCLLLSGMMRAVSPPLLPGDFSQTEAWKGELHIGKSRLYLGNFNRTSKCCTFSVQDNGP